MLLRNTDISIDGRRKNTAISFFLPWPSPDLQRGLSSVDPNLRDVNSPTNSDLLQLWLQLWLIAKNALIYVILIILLSNMIRTRAIKTFSFISSYLSWFRIHIVYLQHPTHHGFKNNLSISYLAIWCDTCMRLTFKCDLQFNSIYF